MKLLLIALCLGMTTLSFADVGESSQTDCPAMNQSRDKVIKQAKDKPVADAPTAVKH
jgi:hypothetical protein